MLGSVTNLNLSSCNIKDKDLYNLKNVHTLNLLGCENITDISALKNVKNLII